LRFQVQQLLAYPIVGFGARSFAAPFGPFPTIVYFVSKTLGHWWSSVCAPAISEHPPICVVPRLSPKEMDNDQVCFASFAVLYFGVVSAAWAVPGSTLPQLTSPNDIVQVGSKSKGKSHKGHSHSSHHHHHYSHNHKYHYHGHYYGHRYSYRPRGAMGCVMAGPVWYCP
jgi:hypothetical protein